jgi:hypothetical protein
MTLSRPAVKSTRRCVAVPALPERLRERVFTPGRTQRDGPLPLGNATGGPPPMSGDGRPVVLSPPQGRQGVT